MAMHEPDVRVDEVDILVVKTRAPPVGSATHAMYDQPGAEEDRSERGTGPAATRENPKRTKARREKCIGLEAERMCGDGVWARM